MSTDEYKPYDQFILFGDSITQWSSSQERGFGFQAALQDAYMRRLDVINRGFAGYNTAHAVKVFPKFFPTLQTATVRFLTVFFGANDACLPGNDKHVPLPTFKENLKTIIHHPATVVQNPRILLITPPPINEYQLEGFDESKGEVHPTRTAKYTKLYAEAVREVGSELKVPVADVWTAFMKAAGWEEGKELPGSRDLPNSDVLQELLTDGLHLAPEGYRVVYTEVMKTIRENWPDQDPEELPLVFPVSAEAPK
ncbi:hypothetical protein PHISCL_09291 [Aspergillus sclerotialis]|uniref:SGNH hydrolase-type esterase domain-containing protein n=1 Tax=Aspergillus sclerotialis TaxID=2070753 RepID=A0A3A2ZMM0_9EURO|nr:hypothetical protein PHISCL_09291 [Aspergillus sclerotialis]